MPGDGYKIDRCGHFSRPCRLWRNPRVRIFHPGCRGRSLRTFEGEVPSGRLLKRSDQRDAPSVNTIKELNQVGMPGQALSQGDLCFRRGVFRRLSSSSSQLASALTPVSYMCDRISKSVGENDIFCWFILFRLYERGRES